MAYKFSKGNRGLGDIEFEDDADTGLDFEQDYIGFHTSGSASMVLSGSRVGIGTTNPDYRLQVAGNIGVNQYIYHNGDADTYINFTDNRIVLNAGNLALVTAEKNSSQPHEVTINDGSNNVDFVVKGNGSNEGNPGMKFDASTNKLGINGVGTPEHELHVDGTGKFTTSIQTNLIEYTDGDDAITIEDGGYLKLHSGIKYARGVLVSSGNSPAEVGGWIKFATLNVPGTSNVDTAASSFLVTFAGQESSNNRTLDGIFLVHAKFTVNTDGTGDGAGNYYETEGTFITCEPLNAKNLSAAGANDFAPATDLLMIFENTDATPVVDLYMKANAKGKHCFVTHLGGTGQTGTFDTDAGWTINTGESWVTNEPAAPGGSVKIGGTYVSKIFSDLTVSGLVYDAPADPTITFSENGTQKATIGVNSSDNIVLENKVVNKHIVLKVNDQGVVKEGLRLDGAVPEVVVNQTSDSLVDFRVESDNQTHMLFVDGSQDRIGIKTDNPLVTLDVNGEVRNNGGVYRKLRDVNSTGNILQTDYVIRCIQNSAITLTLPSKSNNSGQIIILKDALGNANNNNITVQAATGDTIDGSSSYTISYNKEGVTLMCDGINGWMILSRVKP